MDRKLTCYQVFLASGMLITGSINTLAKKAQNDCSAIGLPDKDGNRKHTFSHPWFQTFLMFVGETLCIFGLLLHRYKERQKFKIAKQKLAAEGSDGSSLQLHHPRIFQIIIAVPTMCDLLGTTLSGIGLLYIDASVWQMLRGSIIIFTGIFSRFFLKRQLKLTHWFGIMITVVGLCLVGLSSILSMTHKVSKWHTIIGVVLIVSSQIVSAGQMVIEETFLKKRKYHPLHVVGMEGTFGILLMVFVFLPAVYFIPGNQPHGSYDNSLDALVMIKNSAPLAILGVLYLLSISFYNFFGLAVTKSLTAVHRTLLDACRTLLVWLVGLFIYYVVDPTFGEPWKKTYGVIQVDGFLLLLIGTCMYNQLFDFSWLSPAKKIEVGTREVQNPDYRIFNAASQEGAASEREPLLGSPEEDKLYDSVDSGTIKSIDPVV